MHLFGWFHIILFIAQFVFNQILTWTQYFRNHDWYFFGFSMFFAIVPLLVVSAGAGITATRNYRRFEIFIFILCLLTPIRSRCSTINDYLECTHSVFKPL